MRRSQRGFTAIEVAVVSVILLALAATAFPIYSSYVDDAAVSQARSDCEVIANAVRMYRHDTDQWPANQPLGKDPGLIANPFPVGDPLRDRWKGPYLVNFPTGPRRTIRTAGADSGAYEYDLDVGPDGTPQTADDRARVTCWGLNRTFDGTDPGYWSTYATQGDDIIVYLNRL